MNVSIALALAIQSSFQLHSEVGEWNVYRDETMCAATGDFEGGTSLMLSIDAVRDQVLLIVMNDNWTALRDAERLDISADFDGRRHWNLRVQALTEGTVPGFAASFSGFAFVDDFTAAPGIRLSRNNRPIANLSLSGSAAAVNELFRCLEVVREAPGFDPFSDIEDDSETVEEGNGAAGTSGQRFSLEELREELRQRANTREERRVARQQAREERRQARENRTRRRVDEPNNEN